MRRRFSVPARAAALGASVHRQRQNVPALRPDPQVVGLYITACASDTAVADRKPGSVTTIERTLSTLTWDYTQRGQPLDRKDRHIATVLAGIRNINAEPTSSEGSGVARRRHRSN